MNPLFFDAIFNAKDLIEESIEMGELGIEILEDTKNLFIKNQEKIATLYEKLKTKNTKLLLSKQMNEAYLQLLNIDKEIENAKKNLKYCKNMKDKLL